MTGLLPHAAPVDGAVHLVPLDLAECFVRDIPLLPGPAEKRHACPPASVELSAYYRRSLPLASSCQALCVLKRLESTPSSRGAALR